MPDFFQNNQDQKCPACKLILKNPNSDYPTALCERCITLVTSNAYEKIGFMNNSVGGINAFYLDGQGNFDTNRPYTNLTCRINNTSCNIELSKGGGWGKPSQLYIYTV